MKRSSKTGFTLLEMVAVIALIIILSTVTIGSVVSYIRWSNEQKAKVANHDTAIDRAREDVDSYLVGFTRQTVPSETTDNTPHPGPGPGGGGGGGGNPGGGGGGGGTPTEPSEPSDPSEPSVSETDPTVAPPTDPTVHDAGENAPGSGYSVNSHPGWFGSRLTFTSGMRECIVYYDGTDGLQVDAAGKYTVEKLEDGKYKITYVADGWGPSVTPLTEIPIHVSSDYNTFYVAEWK